MIETKLFEIRDRGTFMPVMATIMTSSNFAEIYLLKSSGFSNSNPLIMVHFLAPNDAYHVPYHWGDRTRFHAHLYIQENWERLKSGDVIDVEYILGETTELKMSQRLEEIGVNYRETF